MRKSSPQTDQGLNIFSSSEWPSAPINAVPRVAMLVHYSSLLVVSKGLKCSCCQIWLNLHFCLKPIRMSLLLVNYAKREQKEDPRGPRWTKVSNSSIAWIASIRVSHLLNQGAARLTKLAVPVVCLETASTQKQHYWGAFPQVEPCQGPRATRLWELMGILFWLDQHFIGGDQRDDMQLKNMFLIDDCF